MLKKIQERLNLKNILIIVTAISCIYLCYTGFTTGINLQRANQQISTIQKEYDSNVKEQKYLNDLTATQRKSLAEEKARNDGYCYPNEKVFYFVD